MDFEEKKREKTRFQLKSLNYHIQKKSSSKWGKIIAFSMHDSGKKQTRDVIFRLTGWLEKKKSFYRHGTPENASKKQAEKNMARFFARLGRRPPKAFPALRRLICRGAAFYDEHRQRRPGCVRCGCIMQ